jgi:hypothetical protein
MEATPILSYLVAILGDPSLGFLFDEKCGWLIFYDKLHAVCDALVSNRLRQRGNNLDR